MFGRQNFVDCINDQLKERGFGQKRAKEIIDRFNGLTDQYNRTNPADAEMRAMMQVFNEIEERTAEKAKRAMSDLLKVGDAVDRFETFNPNTKVWGRGEDKAAGPARVAISFVESDPRAGGLSYSTEREVTKGRLWSVVGDILERFDKGAFGKQRGEAHFPNVVREIFEEDTGDLAAKELATGWRKMQEAAVDLFNAAGGSMRKLEDWNLPQSRSVAKVIREGVDEFVAFHQGKLDWTRTVWPDGAPIEESQRDGFLREVYRTLSSGGANKIEPGRFNGRGSAVGNALEQHRLLHYDGPEGWLAAHQRYGDGNLFDVMVRHVDDMAHKIAMVQTFGSNPSHMADTIRALAMKRAEEMDAAKPPGKGQKSAVAATEGELKNRFDPMFDLVSRSNPMDPESRFGNAVTSLANILTAAQLGAASLLAIPGDFMTIASVRLFNKMGLFDGVSTYFKTLAGDTSFQRTIAAQSAFVHEQAVSTMFASQRFTGISTVGPAISRRISDTIMRGSLLSGHTGAARWTVQSEFMGLLARSAAQEFDKLPFVHVAQRYGITAADWNAFRAIEPWSPKEGVSFLRPIDITRSDIANRDELYRKFQGMIFEESRKMVPEGTIEGSVTLRGTTRPDTLAGALLYSFSMYKNFPMSMMMTYGRLAMTNADQAGRLSFVAGLGAGMVLVGAMGTQMREVSKGRDPLPMDTAAFWGKSLLSGGALSIWGDMLFSGVNKFGTAGPVQVAAGPLVGWLGDTAQLALGDVFKIADAAGSLKPDPDVTFLAKAVEYAKRYTPGSSLWWARTVLERQVFDRLAELADPKAYTTFQRRQQKQMRENGNGYWWAPGDRAPERAPIYRGR